eukprot:CAMPEP_0119010196 /NCGR_PEP_ID=MMETSP1176-20130426/4852_1 /TAXON_ID=265551 /ORGANISM="Synedropsis recta cf, Strain CCMP1620" /LENGTH=455 /DNA_ID=CAMNT_0006962823 /DNA_START=46 /DNA_END=1410 /DNA_ORIENTATION=-
MSMLLSHGLQHQSSSARLVCILKRSYYSSHHLNAPTAPTHVTLAESVVLQNCCTRRPKLPALNVRCLSTTLEKDASEQATWSGWELLLTTAAVSFVSGAFVYSTSTASPAAHQQAGIGFGWGGGGGGGNSSVPPTKAVMAAPLVGEDEDPQEQGRFRIVEAGKNSFDVSARAIKGGRLYMEDEFFVGDGGHFVGVFDGHGGGDVSSHLRQHLYSKFQHQLKRKQLEDKIHEEEDAPEKPYKPSLSSFVAALRQAFTAVDTEVLMSDEMQYQGSTAVAVALHQGEDGSRTLVSANVGDSRAILCRHGKAVDMTRDHKPNDERERARIHAMGEQIEWDNYSKVHRVKNLSLSRAVGDRFAKPAVSGEAEIKIFPIRVDDDFIVLASDGLWDVMTSDQVVNFVNKKVDTMIPSGTLGDGAGDITKRLKDVRRKNMSRYVATEALKRGSGDNICVLIVW